MGDRQVQYDRYGQPMYLYEAHYKMGTREWSVDIWAFDDEDAVNRLTALSKAELRKETAEAEFAVIHTQMRLRWYNRLWEAVWGRTVARR